ncbi:hypothetical protein V1498_01630 [Peribacillus sp. SCS-26]
MNQSNKYSSDCALNNVQKWLAGSGNCRFNGIFPKKQEDLGK